mmetsp:Transcript_8840/g.17851  ORF Transcript_8840/g.17851 Transcript_8840/m.17851 type:complete len:223 (+) Transcript_8840:41-709(+)
MAPFLRDALLNDPVDMRVADLVRDLDEPFNAQDPDHLDACRQLWQAAWANVPFAGVVHEGWTRLGFRTGDLTKELQTGGIALVHNLLKLATFSPTLFASALEGDCPLAQACLAVGFLLREYLRLHVPGTVRQPIGGSGQVASDETLRRFLLWDANCPDAFDMIHLEFLVYLLWGDTELHGRQEQTTLMGFHKALVQTRKRIERTLPRIKAGVCYKVKTITTN